MTVEFIIPLEPRTKKNSQQIRYRNTANGRKPYIAQGDAYLQYEKDAGWFLNKVHKGIDFKVNVKAVYYMPTLGKVDLINLHSALHDCLVKYGVVADDNSNVIATTDGSRVMYDKERSRTEVTITKID